MAEEKLSMVVFSGTVDKLYPVAIMASGAVALGQKVDIFLTFWGLMSFRQGAPLQNQQVTKDYEAMAPEMMRIMQEKKVPSWLETLRIAKEIGDVRIHACAMTMDLFDLKQEDMEDIVDDVTGVAQFLTEAQGGTTLFI
ncbi:MAG: DsrE/DsrF/DrsH-like family protein [Symbiobacteriia bacterium]